MHADTQCTVPAVLALVEGTQLAELLLAILVCKFAVASQANTAAACAAAVHHQCEQQLCCRNSDDLLSNAMLTQNTAQRKIRQLMNHVRVLHAKLCV
jgi:hypothetical protein